MNALRTALAKKCGGPTLPGASEGDGQRTRRGIAQVCSELHAHGMGKVGRDGEPKAASGGVTGGVGLVEAVEEPRSIDAGRARYRVLDRDGGLSSVRELHEDPRRVRAVAHGVGNEILQDAGEGIRIGRDDELSPGASSGMQSSGSQPRFSNSG